VARKPLHDGVDGIAVGQCRRQALQHHHRRAVATDVPVGGGVAELAPSVSRHHPRLRIGDSDVRLQDHVGTAGESEITLAAADALAREVHSHERRRARRVDADARAAQVEEERNATGGRVPPAAGRHVQVDTGRVGEEARLEVVEPHADEHASVGAGDLLASDAGVLERLPTRLEQEPLLRIEALGLAWCHLEELRVEPVDVGEEPARS
jgi:hypothetical protein